MIAILCYVSDTKNTYPNKVMSKSSFVIELFERIHGLKVRNEQNEYLYRLKSNCLFIFLLCLVQCYTHVYKAWRK